MLVANPQYFSDNSDGAQTPLRREVFEAYRPIHELAPYRIDQLHSIDFLTSLCYFKHMSEKQKNLNLDYSELADLSPEELEQAYSYIETVRDAYKSGYQYRGNRSPAQLIAAEQASEDASKMIDDYITALGIDKAIDTKLGGHENGLTVFEMMEAWRHLWVGFAVITNRIASHERAERPDLPHYDLTQLYSLPTKDRLIIMQLLFNDFQEHNALRFGADSAGKIAHRREVFMGIEPSDDDGKIISVEYDPDKLSTYEQIGARAIELGYETLGKRKNGDPIIYMHTAGKMNPKQIKTDEQGNPGLRKLYYADYPDPVKFYHMINSRKDAKKALEEQGS